jgi:hypothetical protein
MLKRISVVCPEKKNALKSCYSRPFVSTCFGFDDFEWLE